MRPNITAALFAATQSGREAFLGLIELQRRDEQILNQIASQGVSRLIVKLLVVTCSCLCYSIKTLPRGGVHYDQQSYDTNHLKYFTEFAFSKEDTSL